MRSLYGAFVCGCLAIGFAGCGRVSEVNSSVQPELDKLVSEGQAKTMIELAKGTTLPTNFVVPARAEASTKPWESLKSVEMIGLLSGNDQAYNLPAYVVFLSELDPKDDDIPKYKATKILSAPQWCKQLVSEASSLRGQAVAKLTPQEKKMVFARTEEIVKEFGPQEEPGEAVEKVLQTDMDFVKAAWLKTNWKSMSRSAMKLLRLSDKPTQNYLLQAMRTLRPHAPRVEGVEGKVLFEEKTPYGWIIFGSTEANTYDIKEPVALIVDLGGNDRYRGRIATQSDADHGVSAILDFEGDDSYEGSMCTLATGRLGCGLIVDRHGNDRYTANFGGIGVGLAGFGMVVDQSGDDTYRGEQYTIGSAIVGMGFVHDAYGNDSYSCDMYGIGLGGPCAIGLVSDLHGDDHYRCGFKEPSGYNAGDAPNAKPGDRNYQYEGWGIGMGLGRRLYPYDKDKYQKYTLAGGIGVVCDGAGDDLYESSNFSLGCGYFFGIGVLVEGAGNDHYKAARYGIGAGAHYAEGLFVDYEGNDVYDSTGPTYNCGCSWDKSIFLFVDARGDDIYNLDKSAGPGRGDIGSWGVAADLEGNDKYNLTMMPGTNSANGLSAFFDGAGKDVFTIPNMTIKDGQKEKVGEAGVFWDK